MRHGQVEIREAAEGPQLRGVMIQEGRAGRVRRELFVPGSVEWPTDGVSVLARHGAAPEVRAIPTRQADGRITLRAPATDAIRQAVAEGRNQMSVEFRSLRERRTEGGIREILRALVPNVALVASPEYDMTEAEVRRSLARTFVSNLKSSGRIDCKCAGQGAGRGVSQVEFDVGAFDQVVREAVAGTRNVSAIGRGAADVIADTVTESLILRAGRSGLSMEMRALETEAARAVGELVRAGVRVYARPIIDFPSSDFTVEGSVAKVARASFDFILVKPTPNAKGLEPLERSRRREGRAMSAEIRSQRRRRLWL